jgi:hypothetical protein
MIVIPNHMRVVMVVSALALAAGLLTLALLSKPAQGQAETTTTTERVPFSEDFTDQCTGELFHIDGTILTVGHSTIDANGAQHFQYVNNTKGTGESLTTGAEYAFSRETHGQANYFGDSYTYYDSYVVTMTRQGSTAPDDDFKITISIKQTINANGELTTEIVKVEYSCT